MFSSESLVSLFSEYGNLSVFISILISVVISLIGVIPSIFVTGANILFWGVFKGIIISIMGEVIGGYITFKVYRIGLKSVSEKIKGRFALVDKILESKGAEAGIFIFQGRVIPFIPSGIVTLASALSNVQDSVFIISTALGKIPSIVLEGLISHDIINIKQNYIRLIFVLIALASGYIFRKVKRSY